VRDYGRVYSKFWTSSDIQALTDDGRLLALYLLSGPHGTIAGVCRLPDGYICEDLKWSPQRVAEGFRELFGKGFANRCETTKWVWVCRFLSWNTPENPNQWKAARKVADSVPTECAWIAAFRRVFAIAAGEKPPPEPSPGSNGSGTLSQPLPTQKQDQDQEQDLYQDQDQKIPTARKSAPSTPIEFLDFKIAYPNRAGDQGWRKAQRAANARIEEGHTWIEILEGARRYAAYVRSTGNEGTEYVKQAATFLGPDLFFTQPWPLPKSKAENHRDSNIENSKEWLRAG
jgi:hypothetical protein